MVGQRRAVGGRRPRLDTPLLKIFNFIFGKFPFDFEGQTENCKQCLRFVDINELNDKDLTFPVDKHVVEMLKIHSN